MEFHLGIAMRHQNWESSLSKGKPKTLGEGKITLGSPSSGLDLRRSQREFGWNFEWIEHLYGFRQLGWKGNPWCGHSQKKPKKIRRHNSKVSPGAPWLHPAGKAPSSTFFPSPPRWPLRTIPKPSAFSNPLIPKNLSLQQQPCRHLPGETSKIFYGFIKWGSGGFFHRSWGERKDFLRFFFSGFFFWNFAPFIWGRRIKITPGFGSFFP